MTTLEHCVCDQRIILCFWQWIIRTLFSNQRFLHQLNSSAWNVCMTRCNSHGFFLFLFYRYVLIASDKILFSIFFGTLIINVCAVWLNLLSIFLPPWSQCCRIEKHLQCTNSIKNKTTVVKKTKRAHRELIFHRIRIFQSHFDENKITVWREKT